MDEPIDMTLVVTPRGVVLVIEAGGIVDGLADGEPWLVGDFHGLPTEPGIYRAACRNMSADAGRWLHFRVLQYEECRIVPSGCFVAVPQPAEPQR